VDVAISVGVSTLAVHLAALKGADVDVTASVGPSALTVDLVVLKGADEAVTFCGGAGTFTMSLAVLHVAFIDAPLLECYDSFAVWNATNSFARVLAFSAVDVLIVNTTQLKERERERSIVLGV